MTPRQKIDIYKNGCYLYGFLTLVCYLQVCQDWEEYEECALIVKALKEINDQTDSHFPTVYGKDATDFVVNYCRNIEEWSEERIIEYLETTVPNYIEQLKQDIKKAQQFESIINRLD